MKALQDLTIVIDFTVTVPRDLWENDSDYPLSFSNSDYSFYDADFISEENDIVTVSVKGAYTVIGTVDMVNESFAEYGNTRETNILFGAYNAPIVKDSLYKVIEEGL